MRAIRTWTPIVLAVIAIGLAASSLAHSQTSPAAWPIGSFDHFPADTPVDVVIDHGHFDPFPPEGESEATTARPQAGVTRIWLVNLGGVEPIAVHQRSPWLGCRVVMATRQDALTYGHQPPTDFERGFVDPCHGGLYSLQGAHLAGPGDRSLSTFPVRIDSDGTLLVDLTDLSTD